MVTMDGKMFAQIFVNIISKSCFIWILINKLIGIELYHLIWSIKIGNILLQILHYVQQAHTVFHLKICFKNT